MPPAMLVDVLAVLTDVTLFETLDQAFVAVEYTYVIPFPAVIICPLVGDDGKDN
jgi:hypothetical protein